MSLQHQISQRDLRMRSKDIMDAVEQGQTFTVTRDGREIGELAPMSARHRFVTAENFAAASVTAPAIDLNRFRADLDGALDTQLSDPYER